MPLTIVTNNYTSTFYIKHYFKIYYIQLLKLNVEVLLNEKIVTSIFLILSTFLYANEVVTEEWDDSSTTYSMPGVFLITYDRFDLSLNDQQKYKMLKDLEEKICSNSNTKALLHKGITVLYNFVYKEGTLLVKIDRCN